MLLPRPARPIVIVVALMISLGLAAAGCTAEADRGPTSGSTTRPPGAHLLYEWFGYGHNLKSQFLSRDDGASPVAIAVDVLEDRDHVHSDWSPDGKRIAFEALSPDGPASIWIADADGSNAVETVVCESASCLQQSYPSWSPDGKSIVFVQGDGGPELWGSASIVVIDLASKQRRTVAVTADGASAFYSPRWSRDATKIVAQYETYPDAQESAISSSAVVIVNADGLSAPLPLTDPTMFAGHPDWSRTQDLIVFDTYDLSAFYPNSPGDSNIFVMKSDGTELRQLTHTTQKGLLRIGEPTWTPDGTRIVASLASLYSTVDKHITDAVIAYVDPETGKIDSTGRSGAQAQLQPVASR